VIKSLVTCTPTPLKITGSISGGMGGGGRNRLQPE
jgi:hypothetical protein